jgi:hypothetical protein
MQREGEMALESGGEWLREGGAAHRSVRTDSCLRSRPILASMICRSRAVVSES